ncbi:MAG TPA: GTP cyclohydrolase I [Chloroflexota bacterium]
MASKSVTWAEIYDRVGAAPPGRLFGIPRGGSIVAGLTGRAVDRLDDADWLVDDVIDTRATADAWTSRVGKPVWGLFDRERDGLSDRQLHMPWEEVGDNSTQRVKLERIGHDLLETLGYDPDSIDLRDTPSRWARWWQEFLGDEPGRRMDSAFEMSESVRMVLVSGMRVWSICEHHLMPFSAEVSIAYVPRRRVLGLSKFARLSLRCAHRLQMQERLASEIASTTTTLACSRDVAVLVQGRHLCMEARGVKLPSLTTSLVTRGVFEVNADLRLEFITLAAGKNRLTAYSGDAGH